MVEYTKFYFQLKLIQLKLVLRPYTESDLGRIGSVPNFMEEIGTHVRLLNEPNYSSTAR